jgi:hypothetical protein
LAPLIHVFLYSTTAAGEHKVDEDAPVVFQLNEKKREGSTKRRMSRI